MKVGDQVVVNECHDACIYEVAELYGKNPIARLEYWAGDRKVGGGEVPVSILSKPSAKQLEIGEGLKPNNT